MFTHMLLQFMIPVVQFLPCYETFLFAKSKHAYGILVLVSKYFFKISLVNYNFTSTDGTTGWFHQIVMNTKGDVESGIKYNSNNLLKVQNIR